MKRRATKQTNSSTHSLRAGIALLSLGLMQMAGDTLGLLPLKGAGAATAASPAPRVFSAIRGFEPYSTAFSINWRDHDGVDHSVALTPELCARLKGPYNRRNIYGAVLAGGPILSTDPALRAMFDAVTAYALCGRAPVLRELNIDPGRIHGSIRLRYEPRPGGRDTGVPRAIAICS